jgi:hypothetical protein
VSRFEYLTVLISIVIALGISEIVSSWGALLRQRRAVRFDWVHAVWTVLVVLLMVQFWWGFWSFRVVETWSFAALVAVVAEAIVMVLASLVLTPRVAPGGGEIDLRAHYFEQSRVFFGLAFVLLWQLAIVDALVGGQPFVHPENAVRGVGLGVTAWGALSRSERVHQALAVASAALLAVFVSVSFSR